MVSFVKPAIMENFDIIMDFIQSNVEDAGFDPKTVKKIRLACEEIILNVIKYAYPLEEGKIEVQCNNMEDKCIIRITDRGIPFDPLEAEKPDINAPVSERKIGGLGIFLILKIMDDVHYEREDNKNVVILTKCKGENK